MSTNAQKDAPQHQHPQASPSSSPQPTKSHHHNQAPSTATSTSTISSTATNTTTSSHHHCNPHQSIVQHQSQQNPSFDSNVISERVKNLATQIYQELKSIISRCNYNEDILSGLMPLIVRVLESLDLALIENQQLQVELELCKDDNEQLVVMFEKEKAAKRAIDKKMIESEYAYEEERQQYQQKIESLDSVVKMMELKAKNASDQAARFEEKEAERKKEYQKLHDRYTELLKSHCDVVERVRHLVGKDEASNFSSINVPHQMVTTSSSDLTCDPIIQQHNKMKFRADEINDYDKASHTRARDTLKSWNAETELTLEDASLVVIEDVLETGSHRSGGQNAFSSSHNESDKAASEADGTEHEKEGENDSIAYTSMEKEFRKLIQDNKDLLNTKNALNVVKDDLIAEVDRLTNEVSMYEQAVDQLNSTKEQMKQKVSTLDAELRKTKEELELAKQKLRENNEEGVPYSQRKRFGRAEMAKVLMERNEFKEKYMELQDTVRYTELIRANANKSENEKRSGLLKFFSNLFGAPPREPLAIGSAYQAQRNSSSVVSFHGSPALALGSSDNQQTGLSGGSGLAGSDAAGTVNRSSILSTSQRLASNADSIVLMDSDLNIDRSRAASRDGSSHFMNTEIPGRIHAYGWSLPVSSFKGVTASTGPASDLNPLFTMNPMNVSCEATALDAGTNKLPSFQVPIPHYCRPLTGDSLGMKIWCATAVDLSGGKIEIRPRFQVIETEVGIDASINLDSSTSIVNITSTPVKSPNRNALRQLEEEVDQALKGSVSPESEPSIEEVTKSNNASTSKRYKSLSQSEDLSSCVWICSTQHSKSKITMIDIKTKPNELMDSFHVPTFLYCIKSIPGCKDSDLLGLKIPSDYVPQNIGQSESGPTLAFIEQLLTTQKREFFRFVKVDPESEGKVLLDRLESKRNSMLKMEQAHADKEGDIERSLDQETQELEKMKTRHAQTEDAEISRILDSDANSGLATLQKLNDFVAHSQPQESGPQHSTPRKNMDKPASANSTGQTDGHQPISTQFPTVWMGGKDSVLYVHSAMGQWRKYIAGIQLHDSILQMIHFRGRVFVALADGTLCVFFRNLDTKEWEFSYYLQIDTSLLAEVTCEYFEDINVPSRPKTQEPTQEGGEPLSLSEQLRDAVAKEQERERSCQQTKSTIINTQSKTKSKVARIRCLELANKNLWIGYRNRVIIIDPITLKLRHSFSVVPQLDNQIRQLVAMKDGVFCCLRSDLILRLYSSLKPYQHIQNIDIEPVVTRLLSPRSFVISHITAMKVVDNTIWIGTAHGIIITIPCTLVSQVAEAPSTSSVNEGDLEQKVALSIAKFMPKCDISNAQISFHGHKDSVKFFINAHNLMLSGGQGYVDFRLDMDDQSKLINDKSHLILWQLPDTKRK